jgi:hypothetical protein
MTKIRSKFRALARGISTDWQTGFQKSLFRIQGRWRRVNPPKPGTRLLASQHFLINYVYENALNSIFWSEACRTSARCRVPRSVEAGRLDLRPVWSNCWSVAQQHLVLKRGASFLPNQFHLCKSWGLRTANASTRPSLCVHLMHHVQKKCM